MRSRTNKRVIRPLLPVLLAAGVMASGAWLGCDTAEPPPHEARQLGATLELAAGEVVLLEASEHGEEAVGRRLLSGTPLPAGATIRTGDGARALVRLGDGTRAFLRDGTTVSFGDGVHLESGHAWIEAPPLERGQEAALHHVGSTTVSLSDGGASLAHHDGEASVYVAEGLAVVSSPGGRTEVNAGEQAVIANDGAPVVEAVKFWDDWTGGMGDRSAAMGGGSGSGALYAVDRQAAPGAPALPLAIQRQSVDVVIAEQVAETRVDQHFFNPSGRDVEGWYWFTVPEGAQLTSFALETDGVLVEAEVVERKQAATTYEAEASSGRQPALLEWIDGRTVRAKIFPVPALGERRVVVRYQQLLTASEGKLRFRYPLAGPMGKDAPTIEEFSLNAELRGDLARRFDVATRGEARTNEEGSAVTMRRSGFTPRADFELELTPKKGVKVDQAPLRLNVVEPGRDQANFVMVRWAPDLELDRVEVPKGDLVVVVDTSAGADPAEHQSKIAVAEALLRSLSEGDRFAVMGADVGAEVLFPGEGLADATPELISEALEAVTRHGTGGATDLGAIFETALERVHGLEQPAIVYIGDGLATSGERGGDELSERLRRSMTGSRARLFTVGVGADADEAMLTQLARVGGGESLRVHDPDEAVVRALQLSGALKTPTITDLEIDLGEGLDDVFLSATGKLSRGQELVLLARTHHELPKEVEIRGRLGGEDFVKTYPLTRDSSVVDELVPRLWAATYVARLLGDPRGPEAVRGKILALGLEYGLMTPFTSFIALESEEAYARRGIERRYRRFPGPRLTADASLLRSPTSGDGVGDRDPERPHPTVIGLFTAALVAPLGCGFEEAAEQARVAEEERYVDQSEHENGSMGGEARAAKPTSKSKSGLYAMKGPKDAIPAMEDGTGRRTTETSAPGQGAAAAAAVADNDESYRADGEDVWGGLEGTEVGEAYGVGGLGLVGTGRGGGGGGGGTIGLGDPDPATIAERGAFGVKSPEAKKEVDMGLVSRLGKVGPGALAPPIGLDVPSYVDKVTASELARRSNHRSIMRDSPIAKNRALPCSDAATRGLAHRRILWTRRLERQAGMAAGLEVYEASVGACEVPGWKDQRVFLQLLQDRAKTEDDIGLLLGHFGDQADARKYLARHLLRRVVDPRLVAAIENALFGSAVDWWVVDRELALAIEDSDRLEILTKALARAPGDPQGERRMIDLLARMGRVDEAVARGRRLRDQGLITPELAQQLGEILAGADRRNEAKRLFSEIVEFDPRSAHSRGLLGDIFFRHGWYEDAYRQYEDLVEMTAENHLAAIRLARAAAGAERTDEALRLLRKVASGEGRPGANDPRRWARLHAAVLLSGLLQSSDAPKESVERELKRLQMFEGSKTWVLLTWFDHGTQLVATPTMPKQSDRSPAAQLARQEATALLANAVDAAPTGLFALELPSGAEPELGVRHRGFVPDRDVAYELVTLRFDGTHFSVESKKGTIPALATSEEPEEPEPEEPEPDPEQPREPQSPQPG